MYRTVSLLKLAILAILFTLFTAVIARTNVSTAQLRLSWTDNANNEYGFRIERKPGTGGTYTAIASLPANATSYVDRNLPGATIFCYRVNAYNAIGSSGYSNEQCGTTASLTPGTYSLTVSKAGTGSGTVTATGINCGNDCSQVVNSGTQVVLTPKAAAGSSFAGWSGAGCGSKVTVTGNRTCTATFNLITYKLTVVNAGTGTGTVIAAGITCGSDCSQVVNSGTQVVLTPKAAAGSSFAGWSGAGCGSKVTVTGNRTCTATFNLNTYKLTVVKAGTGSGTVTGTGINCGNDCSQVVNSGTQVVLTPKAAAGSSFAGWSGAGCGSKVTVTGNRTCTAIFHSGLAFKDRLGVYRPSTGEWFLDLNGNTVWDGCQTDLCAQTFSAPAALPMVGEWDATGLSQLGLYFPETGQWYLDTNTNETWEGCVVDICAGPIGQQGDMPVAGKWTSGSYDQLGIFRPGTGYWFLDKNSDGNLGSCRRDQCVHLSVYIAGDLPVVGDWDGDGRTDLGLFRQSSGQWFLDENGNESWNGCGKDRCINSFGSPGDRPVVGDWSGSGMSDVGIFRPSTGEWFLDFNGNGKWDGCGVDVCIANFGSFEDIPVVGKW